jgi:glutamate transport system permease protein
VDVLVDNFDTIVDGFALTLGLLALSGLIALVLGTVLAGMRVSPIGALRAFGTSYIFVFRNTPLLIIFIFTMAGLPVLGLLQDEFFLRAVLALGLYTAAFVCEALRSGINAVETGQAEAARSVGMTFTQTLGIVVFPQAFRTVIPPLASVLIALAKNTSLAAGFGIAEATFRMRGLANNFPGDLLWIFFGIALGYVLIVAVISGAANVMERRLVVHR